jgi:hypothetical protein
MIMSFIVKIVLFLIEILAGFLPNLDFDFDVVSVGFLLNDEFDVPFLLSAMSFIVATETAYLTYRVVKFIITFIRGAGA